MLVSQNQKCCRIDSKMEERWIKHYSSCHKILLVGEGDFSFALSLARAFCSASNIVATSFDSKVSLQVKYSRATINQIELKRFGCTILHEVDALTMDQHPLLLGKIFDRIVFNFPQDIGFAFHKIQNHQKLVLGFLQNARKMLSRDGEVHVTLNCTHPFNKWEVVKLAKKAGLVLVKKVPFKMQEYPCYTNRRGSGLNWDGKFDVGYYCSTFKFSKAKNVQSFVAISEITVDPNSLRLKDTSECELKLSSKDQTVRVSTSTNLIETTIYSPINTTTNSNSNFMKKRRMHTLKFRPSFQKKNVHQKTLVYFDIFCHVMLNRIMNNTW
ncbi:uncharacterized protein At4g26485-like [Trifolium pratense]|uniref:uncharacterized protein At4g26485-like n=1 Tax=Trifolium pratense TaxID=57577 RepID=UPI001E690F84|nr:uncharacterized protein At4g26485-like [Trifolium pratense]